MYLNDANYYSTLSSYPSEFDNFNVVVNGVTNVTANQWNHLGAAVISTQGQIVADFGSPYLTTALGIHDLPPEKQFPLLLGSPNATKNNLVIYGSTALVPTTSTGLLVIMHTPPEFVLDPMSAKVSLLLPAGPGPATKPATVRGFIETIRYVRAETYIENYVTIRYHRPMAFKLVESDRLQVSISGHLLALPEGI